MNIEAIIFDLDGTLLNTIEDLADSMNQVLAEYNFPIHDTDKYFYFIGNGARTLVERALPEDQRNENDISRYLMRYRDIYREKWNVKTKQYAGIEELLSKLKVLNLPMAILSNKPHSDVKKCVDYFFENSAFSIIAGQKDFIPHKPEPDGVHLIIEELKVKPENCLFVGDSSVDMKTAKASGTKAVGVSWGFRSKEELLENGADFIIDEPLDLLSLLQTTQ